MFLSFWHNTFHACPCCIQLCRGSAHRIQVENFTSHIFVSIFCFIDLLFVNVFRHIAISFVLGFGHVVVFVVIFITHQFCRLPTESAEKLQYNARTVFCVFREKNNSKKWIATTAPSNGDEKKRKRNTNR